MVKERPVVKPRGRYTAVETAEILGIHRNTLLNHAKEGNIRFSVNKRTMRKYYEGLEILRFWNNS